MLVITPGEVYPIIRQLDDLNDTTTYFVQAKVRNSRTGSLIATINLTDAGAGSQRFTGTWQASQFSTPTYVDIESKVYTDAGYTVLSTTYATMNVVLLVDIRPGMQNRFGGGGGTSVNYEKVRTIVREELENKKFPEYEKVDFTQIEQQLDFLTRLFQDNKPKDVDFSAIMADLTKIKGELNTIPRYQNEVDLAPILAEIRGVVTLFDIRESVSQLLLETEGRMKKDHLQSVITKMDEVLSKSVDSIREVAEEVRNTDIVVKAVSSPPVKVKDYNLAARKLMGNG